MGPGEVWMWMVRVPEEEGSVDGREAVISQEGLAAWPWKF
jgi:hypothetical protein